LYQILTELYDDVFLEICGNCYANLKLILYWLCNYRFLSELYFF